VCSATGKPAPQITWLDDRDLNESTEIRQVQNTNGTVTVENRLTFSINHHHVLACILDHPQGRKMKAVYPERGTEGVQKSTITMAVLIAVLFLIILIYFIMRQINRRRKKQKRCSAPRSPAEEEGLHQDLSKKAMSPHTPKDQHAVYQNE
ncbi:MO2R4 protein, partial [Aegotheles bennettii]|nr:MO2R4 protein [Aegotheles bennettii]